MDQAAPSAEAPEDEGEGDDGADLQDIAALQANLDLELAQMLAQLATVRQEAAAAANRKEELKKELAALMAGGDFGVEELEEDEALGAGLAVSATVPA